MIHHSAIRSEDHPEQVSIIERSHANRYHEGVKGSHTAYHYIVGSDGTVKQLRDDDERTTHTGCGKGETRCRAPYTEVNERSIAVVVAGDFTNKLPNRRQMVALKALVERLQKKYSVPNKNVIPHRSVSPTSCPGNALVKALWPDL